MEIARKTTGRSSQDTEHLRQDLASLNRLVEETEVWYTSLETRNHKRVPELKAELDEITAGIDKIVREVRDVSERGSLRPKGHGCWNSRFGLTTRSGRSLPVYPFESPKTNRSWALGTLWHKLGVVFSAAFVGCGERSEPSCATRDSRYSRPRICGPRPLAVRFPCLRRADQHPTSALRLIAAWLGSSTTVHQV